MIKNPGNQHLREYKQNKTKTLEDQMPSNSVTDLRLSAKKKKNHFGFEVLMTTFSSAH